MARDILEYNVNLDKLGDLALNPEQLIENYSPMQVNVLFINLVTD